MKNFGLENEYTEFKTTTKELDDSMKAISAMLNKNGKGALYFGVKKNGDAVGFQISESTLRDISRKISEKIRPVIYPKIFEMEKNPGVIKVEFAGYYKPYSADGKFYIRVADENKQIDVKELIKMIYNNDASNSLWEKLESDETIDDVDESLLISYIAKANECGRINEKYNNKKETTLNKLGLITNNKLNNAGRVLFSKNKPLTLKLAVFASDEKLSFLDIYRYEGNIFELIEKGQQYIKEHINYSADIINEKRVETPEVPLEAIKEAVTNSLCHSSFDSTMTNEIYITPTKVSIYNPGEFPQGYDPKDFAYKGFNSILRNPLIAKILYYSKDIESWSTGFRRIFSLCDKNNTNYSYTMKNQGFEFIFYRKIFKTTKLEQMIINIIRDNPNVTIAKISEITKKSNKTIQNKLNELKSKGLITRIGTKKLGEWHIN